MADAEAPLAASKVETFYEELQPRYIDILSSLGSSQSVVIDGDSVLLQALTDPSLNLSNGLQWAQLLYLVEQTVLPFLERKARLQVVFFKGLEVFWAHNATQQLARRVLVRHMKVNMGLKVVDQIDHWWADTWTNYVAQLSPALIILHDGEGLREWGGSGGGRLQLVLRAFLAHALTNRRTCAFLNQSTSKDHSILAFTLGPRFTKHFTKADVEGLGMTLARDAAQCAPAGGTSATADFIRCASSLKAPRAAPDAVPADTATAAVMWACARLLEKDQTHKEMAGLHWALLAHLPLQARAQEPTRGRATAGTHFLDLLHRELLTVVNEETLDRIGHLRSTVQTGRGTKKHQPTAVELVDETEAEHAEYFTKEGIDFGDARVFCCLAERLAPMEEYTGGLTSEYGGKEDARFVVQGAVACQVRRMWVYVAEWGHIRGGSDFPLQLEEQETGFDEDYTQVSRKQSQTDVDPNEKLLVTDGETSALDTVIPKVVGDPPGAFLNDEHMVGEAGSVACGTEPDTSEAADDDWETSALGDTEEVGGLPREAQLEADSRIAEGEEGGGDSAEHGLGLQLRTADETIEEDQASKLLPIDNNLLVTDFLGDALLSLPQHALDTPAVRQLQTRSAEFNETYHWHTGKDLEDSYWQEASSEYASVHNLSAEALLVHPAFQGRHSQRILQQFWEGTISDYKGLSMREWAQAHVKRSRERNEQTSARALQRYAASLSGTKFCAPTVVLPAQTIGSRAAKSSPSTNSSGERSIDIDAGVRKGGKEKKPPGKKAPSKKELIIAANLEKKAESEREKVREKWAAVQKGFRVSARGFTAREATELEDFMRTCADAREVFYEVAQFYVEGCLGAWKEMKGGALERARVPPGSGDISEPFTEDTAAARVWPAVAIFQLAHTLLDDHGEEIRGDSSDRSKVLVKSLAKAFENFGFTEESQQLLAAFTSNRNVSEKARRAHSSAADGQTPPAVESVPRKPGAAGSSLGMGMSAIRFQLQYMGHLLPKRQASERVVRDARVGSMVADAWQSRVLDVVDSKASALVCAPTSSGKTLISGYCMRNVLSEDDGGVVVFVAPTKALVNQVRAQVAKDFGADVPGVFTRDFYVRPIESRVLVTVPACLEILLLSPGASHAAWRQKLRYVIFDEIHCIGELESGDLWEHLMLLIRCPFLALSATVNNPREFQAWLQQAKEHQRRQDDARGSAGSDLQYQVHLIEHHERHADLEQFQYIPKSISTEDDDSLPSHNSLLSEAVPAFRPFHPYASLEAHRLREEGFPGDMSLSPAATLQLYDAMTTVICQEQEAPVTNPNRSQLQAEPTGPKQLEGSAETESSAWRKTVLARLEGGLAPEVFFQGAARITRPRVRAYEAALEQEMLTWAGHVSSAASGSTLTDPTAEMQRSDGHGAPSQSEGFCALEALLRALNGDLSARVNALEQECQKRGVHLERDLLGNDIMTVLLGLAAQDWLPALVFNFSRGQCLHLARRVVERLESAEAEAEQSGDRSAERAKAQLLERKRKEEKLKRDKKSKGEDAGEGGEGPQPLDEEDDELLCDPGFTFIKKRERMPLEELRELLEPLIESFDDGADHILIRGLIRGVGVHHSGLSTKYRQVVEILFRAKHLRVVFATGTLAYGINMPCRTVVFAGDSIFLDPLQFRQMSGRAGRRGFDSVGRVVFFGVPTHKLRSLLTSAVPDLKGHFPLSVTLVLRLLLLDAKCTAAKDVTRDAMVRLLSNPLYASGGRAELGQQMKHLFRFSLELLMRAQLLDVTGTPLGLAGLAVHLFWSEPANMAFIYLLRTGVFHQICDGRSSYDVSRELLLVCAHLFGRFPLHPLMAERAKKLLSPSKIVLPPLPPFVAAALSAHNEDALRTFSRYIVSYARANEATLPNPCVLPVSRIEYPTLKTTHQTVDSQAHSYSTPTPLLQTLRRQAVPFSACSPFVALSGSGDRFRTVRELVRNVRTGLYVNESAMPVLELGGGKLELNAYILDYFAHGQKEALVRDNGLLEGDAYEALKNFVMVLRTITTAFAKLGPGEELERGDPVIVAFTRLSEEYQAQFLKFNA